MTELKPCPFCGGEAEVFDYWNEGKKKNRWVVMCKNCKGGLGELDTKEEAFEKWNNRWMIPCEEGETEGNWHTGTPTEEGWYLVAYRKRDCDGSYFWDYDTRIWQLGEWNCSPYEFPIIKWQKIEEGEEVNG